MKIEYVKGDATAPIGKGHKLIVHICNDQGGWGAGFVLAISKRWKAPEKEYRALKKNGYLLGDIQVVPVTTNITVVNMIAQHKYAGFDNPVAVRYDALKDCLRKVALQTDVTDFSVHMPRIGCGLAGGTWDKVEPIIEAQLIKRAIAVTVYDFE